MVNNNSKFPLPFSYRIAFTLIELLVVIAIIGILSGMIVVSMSGVTQKANIAKAQVFSNSLRNSLMTNIVGEWKFEGNANDSWGLNSGTLYGDATYFSDCIFGKCLSLDGSGDYISVNATSLYSSITQTVWVKTNNVTLLRQYIFTNQKNPPDTGYYTYQQRQGVMLSDDDVQVQYWKGDGDAFLKKQNIVLNNVWMNIVWTAGPSGGKLYINGVLADNIATVPFTNIVPNQSLIGRRGDANGEDYFNGFIDDLRVFNVEISISQIKEDYYLGLNKLFGRGQITKEDYGERLTALENKTARE
ncbi:MAG: LamG-like jellyroll fold domain-containing protein [Candidatus Paceibacterota bacterium]